MRAYFTGLLRRSFLEGNLEAAFTEFSFRGGSFLGASFIRG